MSEIQEMTEQSSVSQNIGEPTSTTADAPIKKSDTVVIWVLLAAAFVAILNETTMGLALPHLARELEVSELTAQWITSAFMLTMAVVIPTTGYILQRFTTRQVFFVAISLFTLGTLLAFLSFNFWFLLFARIVQASGTAIMMPLLMTTLMNLIPAHSRGRMMGRVSIVMALAPAAGPIMAGVILDLLSWQWIFGLVLPISIIAFLIGFFFLTNVTEPSESTIDTLSVILSAFGFGGLVFGLSQISSLVKPDVATSPWPTIIAFIVGAVGIVVFLIRQLDLQKTDTALLDLRVFKNRNFTLAIIQLGILSITFFGVIIVLPIFMQEARGISPTDTGIILLPGALAMGLFGPIIGRIYDAKGARILLIPGAIIASGSIWFLTLVDEFTEIWVLLAANTILDIGLALSFTPLFTASLSALPKPLYSYGSAVIGTIQQVAGAAGVAVMMAVFTIVMNAAGGNMLPEAITAGSQTAFLMGAILATPTVLVAFFIRKPDAEEATA